MPPLNAFRSLRRAVALKGVSNRRFSNAIIYFRHHIFATLVRGCEICYFTRRYVYHYQFHIIEKNRKKNNWDTSKGLHVLFEFLKNQARNGAQISIWMRVL